LPALIVDAKYESKSFYNNNFGVSIDGQKLGSRYGPNGNWRKVIQLLENQDGNESKFKSRIPSLVHCLFSPCPTSEPPSLLAMLPFVASLPSSLIPMTTILIDEGYIFEKFCDIFFEDMAN
jgi:hypothetical protein